MRRLIISLVLASCIGIVSGSRAHAQVRYLLEPESRLWIEGRSTINQFMCAAGEIDGFGMLAKGKARHAAAPSQGSHARLEVVIPVRSFDCGKRRMNKDLYEALKAEDFPSIEYELEHADLLNEPEGADGAYRLRVRGRLWIAGVDQVFYMEVTGTQEAKDTFRVIGGQELLMSDFGVDPPHAMFGLIKAKDEIVVRFDLVARPEVVSTVE